MEGRGDNEDDEQEVEFHSSKLGTKQQLKNKRNFEIRFQLNFILIFKNGWNLVC